MSNPHETLTAWFRNTDKVYVWTAPECADRILDALCPPGEMRVIDRRPQPCPECVSKQGWRTEGCPSCGGRGTVDTDRIHGLRPWTVDDLIARPMWALVDVGDTEGEAT